MLSGAEIIISNADNYDWESIRDLFIRDAFQEKSKWYNTWDVDDANDWFALDSGVLVHEDEVYTAEDGYGAVLSDGRIIEYDGSDGIEFAGERKTIGESLTNYHLQSTGYLLGALGGFARTYAAIAAKGERAEDEQKFVEYVAKVKERFAEDETSFKLDKVPAEHRDALKLLDHMWAWREELGDVEFVKFYGLSGDGALQKMIFAFSWIHKELDEDSKNDATRITKAKDFIKDIDVNKLNADQNVLFAALKWAVDYLEGKSGVAKPEEQKPKPVTGGGNGSKGGTDGTKGRKGAGTEAGAGKKAGDEEETFDSANPFMRK